MNVWLVLTLGVFNIYEEGKGADIWVFDVGVVTIIDRTIEELSDMFDGGENGVREIIGTKCCNLEDFVETSYIWLTIWSNLWNYTQISLSTSNTPSFGKGIEGCNWDW